MSQKKIFNLRSPYNKDNQSDNTNTTNTENKVFKLRENFFNTEEYRRTLGESPRIDSLNTKPPNILDEVNKTVLGQFRPVNPIATANRMTSQGFTSPVKTQEALPSATPSSIFTPTPSSESSVPKTFSNTFIDKPQEPTFINKFYHVVKAIEENPVVNFAEGFGATVVKTLGISALQKWIGREALAKNIESKAEEFGVKHPVASLGTQIGSYAMPMLKGTQVISKVPKLKPFAAPLAAAAFETAKGALEKLSPKDIATKAATSATFMAAGGVATKGLESVGAKILQNSPQALKNSIAAELAKNIFAGAGGGVVGGAVARQVTNPGEMPTSKDMLYDAVLMGVMHGFNAIPGTLMQAKGVSEQLKQDSTSFAQNMEYLNSRAVTEPNVGKKIEFYNQMKDGIDKSLSNLYNNRFVGSNKVVENFQESLMFGRNAVEKKISDLSGLLNKTLPGTEGNMQPGTTPSSNIPGALGVGNGINVPTKTPSDALGMGAFVPQQNPFKSAVKNLPPLQLSRPQVAQNIPQATQNIPQTTPNVPQITPNVPQITPNVPQTTGQTKDNFLESSANATEKVASFKGSIVNISMKNGRLDVPAKTYKGLAIHKSIQSEQPLRFGSGYIVTHAPSGVKIDSFSTEKDARLYAQTLADSIDTTKPLEELDAMFKDEKINRFHKDLKNWVLTKSSEPKVTNQDRIKNAVELIKTDFLSPDAMIDKIMLQGKTVHGFDIDMREQIARELIQGIISNDEMIKINVRNDGQLEIYNTPEAISTVFDRLNIKLPELDTRPKIGDAPREKTSPLDSKPKESIMQAEKSKNIEYKDITINYDNTQKKGSSSLYYAVTDKGIIKGPDPDIVKRKIDRLGAKKKTYAEDANKTKPDSIVAQLTKGDNERIKAVGDKAYRLYMQRKPGKTPTGGYITQGDIIKAAQNEKRNAREQELTKIMQEKKKAKMIDEYREIISGIEKTGKTEYNNSEDIKTGLTKTHPEYTESQEGRADLETATEAIQDLQKLEADREKGDLLSSDGRKNAGGTRYRTRTIGNAITVKAITTGKVNIKGAKVNDVHDLAEIAQVFRDPRFETMRYIFVKNGIVVHYEGVCSAVAGMCAVNPYAKPLSEYKDGETPLKDFTKWSDELNGIMKKTGADGYYLLHNHPGGSMKASKSDINATENIASRVAGFIAHVIIDSNKYHIVEIDGLDYKGTTVERKFHEIDKILTPSKKHPLLGEAINSTKKLGDIALGMKNSNKLSTLIHVNSQNEIVGIQEVPNEMIKDSQYLKDFLRPKNKEFGSAKSFIVTNDESVYENIDKSLITDGFIIDLVRISKDKRVASFLEENRDINDKPDYWMGKSFEEYPAMRVKEETEKYNKKPFFSKLQQVIEDKMPNRADKDLIYNLINKNGVKQEEIKWSGLNDFMKGKDRVGKQELLDFLRMNELQIEEIELAKDATIKYSEADAAELDKISVDLNKYYEDISELYNQETGRELDPMHLIDRMYSTILRKYLSNIIKDDNELSKALTLLDRIDIAQSRQDEIVAKYPAPSKPKYESYQLPHGKNYRELLFQLPMEEVKYIIPDNAKWIEKDGRFKLIKLDSEGKYLHDISNWKDSKDEAIKEIEKGLNNQSLNISNYHSQHWDEANILAHVRLNDRMDAQGNKVLFIEELQSDWHQAGRKKGYKTLGGKMRGKLLKVYFDKSNDIWVADYQNIGEEEIGIANDYSSLKEATNEAERLEMTPLRESAEKVPDAPFQKSWHEFVLKRMIRYAAENGYDKIAWTTGDIQNKRYDLSKQIKEIAYWKEGDQIGISVSDLRGNPIIDQNFYAPDKLEDVLGREIANKILNDEGADDPISFPDSQDDRAAGVRYISGDNLTIGGSGMKGFYDKIIPDYLNQYGKRWQAKVGKSKLSNVLAKSDKWEVFDTRDGRVLETFDSRELADEYYDSVPYRDRLWLDFSNETGVQVQSFPITDGMKKSVMTEGQALFEDTPDYKTELLTSPLDMELPPASGANTSGRARRSSEIISDFEKRFLNKVRVGKINRANVLGYFQIRTHVIRLRKANDIPTFTHEAGHLIDKLYQLSKVGTMSRSGVNVSKVKDELLRLGKNTTSSKDEVKLRKEGIAEFTRLYLTDQPQAFSRAPETFEYYKKVVDPDLMGFLDQRMQDIWDLVNLLPEDRVMRDVWNKEEVDTARRKAEGLRLKLEQFYTQTVDEYFPAIKDAGLLAGSEGEKRIKQLVAQNRGYESSAMFSLNPKGINGMYQSDLHGNKVGPSLFEILEPIANDKKKQDYFWKSYVIARRAEDYDARKLQLPNDIETYRQTVKNLEIKYPDFPEIFKKVRHYDDNLLNLLVQSGFFSKEQAKEIRKQNPNHIHLFRVMDDGIVQAKSTKGNPVKSLKGGGQEILNPYESMVNMTFVIWGAAKRQQLLLELADMANKAEGMGAVMVKSPYEFKVTEFNLDEVKKQIINSLLQQGVNLDAFYVGFDIDLEFDTMVKIFRPNFFAKANQLAIYRNGKIELYDVEPELYKSLAGMNPVTFNTTMKVIMNVMMKVGDFQAASILYTPRFIVWNTVRESVSAWLQTRAGISMFDIVKGAVSVMKHDPWFLETVKRGGTTEMFLANEAKFVNDTIKELSLGRSTAKRVFNKLRHPLNTLREVIKFTELGTKTAEAKKTVENKLIKRFADQIGKGEFVTKVLRFIDPNIRQQWKTFFDITNTTTADWDEAIFNMRDLTYDIKRKGKTVKELNVNRIFRFFNAYVQGMDQFVRTSKDPDRNKRLLIRGIMLALFSMALHSFIKDNEWYKKLKPYQKDNFWNIPIGDPKTTKTFVGIPRGFEYSIPFMALPVRMMDYFWNDNPDAWDGFATSLQNNFMYEMIPMSVRPFIEQATNTTWQSIPIENFGDKFVSPEYRYDDRTSELAKGISRVTNKLPFAVEAIQSPKRIEHLIRGFTGTTGGVAISAIDQMAGKSNYKASDMLKDMPYLNAIKDVPGVNVVIASFFVDAEKSNTIREEYFKGMEEATKGYNDLKKSGEVTDKSIESFVLNQIFNKFDNALTKMNKLKKALEAVKTDEAREDSKKIDSAMLEMQKDMLRIEKEVKESFKKAK